MTATAREALVCKLVKLCASNTSDGVSLNRIPACERRKPATWQHGRGNARIADRGRLIIINFLLRLMTEENQMLHASPTELVARPTCKATWEK